MSDPRILITGAAGFVGSHLVEYLLSKGYNQVFGTSLEGNAWLTEVLGERALQVDLTDQIAVKQMLEQHQPEWIVHLAGIATVGDSFSQGWKTFETNSRLQYVMLEAMRELRSPARLLSIGSATAYGLLDPDQQQPQLTETTPFRPTNVYAVSKLAQEYLSVAYHLSHGLDVVLVRPFNQIGPRQTADFAVPAFAQQIVKIERGEQQTLQVGNLSAVRDFTDVRDAVRAYEVLLQQGQAGEAYNLGSGVGVSLQEVVDELTSLAKTPVQVEVDTNRLRPVDVPMFVADNQKLRQLGWTANIPLRQTLEDILEYERNKENT